MSDQWIDLHVHSSYSDGLLKPYDVVQYASKMKLKAIAIADHDTTNGIHEAIQAGEKYDVEVIPAVELSTQYQGRDIHILGYYFDMTHPRLMEYLKIFRDERLRRAGKIVDKLKHSGVHIDMSDVSNKACGNCIGRPHIAEVLMEKGYVETFQEAFHRYIGYDSKAYVDKYKISPEEAITLIGDAKGLSFLAHPGYHVSLNMIGSFIKSGLDGIEVVHPKLSPKRTEELQRVAKENQLLISGGSDCHGGRNGNSLMGQYIVPYTILESFKEVSKMRWDS